jgi:hypothetical protein
MPPSGHKRIGRVRRGIMRAFIAAGHRDLTTSQMLQWTHVLALYRGPCSGYVRHYYRLDVRRCAEQFCERVGRSETGRGRPMLWRLKTPLR